MLVEDVSSAVLAVSAVAARDKDISRAGIICRPVAPDSNGQRRHDFPVIGIHDHQQIFTCASWFVSLRARTTLATDKKPAVHSVHRESITSKTRLARPVVFDC